MPHSQRMQQAHAVPRCVVSEGTASVAFVQCPLARTGLQTPACSRRASLPWPCCREGRQRLEGSKLKLLSAKPRGTVPQVPR